MQRTLPAAGANGRAGAAPVHADRQLSLSALSLSARGISDANGSA
jgi:hypothetical protein